MSDNTNYNEQRYSRQTLFSPIGIDGQQQIIQSRIAIVGMGALGTALANHMARAGVGYIRIIDRDFVEWSNLQRQMLFDEADAEASAPKAIAAAKQLQRINSSIEIEPHIIDLNSTNAAQLLAGVDLILDGSDNFLVRFLINDVSIKLGIPWIYGGAVSSRGMSMTIIPKHSPCLRCMFGHAPQQGTGETCDTAGVIGPIIHLIASYQAAEALKLLVGDNKSLNRHMVQIDLWHNQYASIDLSKAKKNDCPACAKGHYEYLDAVLQGETIQSLCGRNAVQIHPIVDQNINLSVWTHKWEKLGKVESTPFLIKLHLDKTTRLVLFPDGRVIIQGIDDLTIAKNLYSRYIGT
jgi:molybdopterin/thiamine biosynthesis adenylyltransferase